MGPETVFATLSVAGLAIATAIAAALWHRPFRAYALCLGGLASMIGAIGAWGTLTVPTAIGAFLAFFALGAAVLALPVVGTYLIRSRARQRPTKTTV